MSQALGQAGQGERRVDAADGGVYTYEQMQGWYADTYSAEEIDRYWQSCAPATGGGRGGGRGGGGRGRAFRRRPRAQAGGSGQGGAKGQGKAGGGGQGKGAAAPPAAGGEGAASGGGGGADGAAGGSTGDAGGNAGHEEVEAGVREGQAAPKARAKARGRAGRGAAAGTAPRAPQPAGNYKVCVLGASGGIGQLLSLLVGMDPNVSELCVVDLETALVPPAGVAADLSHLERKCRVKGYALPEGKDPVDCLQEALTGAHMVFILAAVPRTTQEDLFDCSVQIVRGPVEACAKFCPDAMVGLIVNPSSSVVPAMAEMYAKKGLDPMKIVGVTTVDVVRANKFAAQATGRNPNFINVPVVGGDVGATILPLFSQDRVAKAIDSEKIPDLDKHVQCAGTEVSEAKGGKSGPTLSAAYAAARFGKSVLAGLSGRRRIECTFCKSDVTDLPYFGQKVVLGENGILRVLPLGDLTEHEAKRLEEVKPQLRAEVERGLRYAAELKVPEGPPADTAAAIGGA